MHGTKEMETLPWLGVRKMTQHGDFTVKILSGKAQ